MAKSRGERDRLRGREGDIAPGTVLDVAVLVPLPQLRPVRHLAFEHRPEGLRVDRAGEAERVRALARSGAHGLVRGIVLRVVAVALEIADALRRRGDFADRSYH